MAKGLRFDNRVALVTGAGNGLGRSHALLLASRGAKVVVNDLGGSADGAGSGSAAADAVVAEIVEAGGEAVANYDSVEDGAKLVQTAMDTFGRLDIVINNAGILRDKTFAKMSEADWDLVYRVHVRGAFSVTHAAWPVLREAQYGRVLFTSSAAGIYGNFGQSNYGMAKLGLVGFANTLALEGQRRNITVNTLAPLARSRLTEGLLPEHLLGALDPDYVASLAAWLVHHKCEETGGLFEVGGGYYGKLRWERAAGKMFRHGRAITPEQIKSSWKTITSFEDSLHPADINASLQPIMANIQKGPSLGGNKLIDLDLALGYEGPEETTTYTKRDMSLYALGIGAGADPGNQKELATVYELHRGGFRTLPTYGVVPPINAMLERGRAGQTAPGMNYGLDRLLHGEQYMEVTRPLPPEATLTHRSKITDIWDKGKNAVVVTETQSFDEDGDLLVTNRFKAVIRGAGGWGGERGPAGDENEPPDRAPDATTRQTINASQALLYRLSGDWNPLHADAAMAKAFGFEKPILHGLCTFGYAARHVIGAFCDGDPRYFKSISVRFAGSVYPGETLVTEMWKEADDRVLFRCRVEERDAEVITRAVITLFPEIPKKKKKKKKAAAATTGAAAAPAESAEPCTRDIFTAIAGYIGDNPDLAKQVGHTFVFELRDPASAWTVDLKTGAGAVEEGGGKADCTLKLTDSDFMDMCTGKADAQKLYFGGQLEIGGNVMASQKLEFLRKLEPERVMAAAKARAGGGAAAPAAPKGPESAAVFSALGAYIAKNPDLVGQVGHVFRFELSDPASVWTMDLKAAPGAIAAGGAPKPDCTLALSEADFMAMTRGEADPQKLYFGGQLQISGNVMASQKLDFMSKLDPAEVAAAAAEAPAAAAAPAPAAAPREPVAGALIAALKARLAEKPSLAGETGATVVLRISDPDATWTLDLTSAGGTIAEGAAEGADCVLTLADEDLGAFAGPSGDARDLFMHGKLRVDGDLAVVQRLGWMKGLIEG